MTVLDDRVEVLTKYGPLSVSRNRGSGTLSSAKRFQTPSVLQLPVEDLLARGPIVETVES
jgi:hypothetical protein